MASFGMISDVIKQHFKFTGHSKQIQVIQSYTGGKDSILCAPTAFGKSVPYQAGNLIFKALGRSSNQVMVVTPLLSLISDSVRKTNSLGESFSAISLPDVTTTLAHIQSATHIFTTPESVFEGRWKSDLVRNSAVMDRIALVVIDECHVITS